MKTLSAPPRPPVDPRIRRRMVEVRRAAGRRRLRWLIVVVAVATVVAGVLALLHSPLLSVRSVTVSAPPGRAASVRSVLAGQRGRPLVDVAPGALQGRLERLPWVATAVVTRQWPSGLRAVVSARQPVATVSYRGRTELVDASGRVVGYAGPSAPDVALAAGGVAPGANLGPDGRTEAAVAARLTPDLAARVRTVSVQGGADQLVLQGGAVVRLGSNLEASLASLRTVLAQVDMTGVTGVDLQVPDLPVLTRG